jgi:DNA-binding transcriptional LysR family regulator
MAPGLARRMMLRAILPFQQQYPEIEIVLLSIDNVAEIGDKGVDVLVRPHARRARGGHRPEPQGLVVRKLAQLRLVVCASPEYLERAGTPRTPGDLLQHACVGHISMERDVQNEWQFVKSQTRQKIKLMPRLRIQGVDALREAANSGFGIIRPHTIVANGDRSLSDALAQRECHQAA